MLAVLCIGGMELVMCSYFAPELYARITAPVRTGIQYISDTSQEIWDKLCDTASTTATNASARLQNTWDQLQASWEEFTAPPEPELEELQLVDGQVAAPPPRPPADLDVTVLTVHDGQEYLTGGTQETVYFDQTAEPWAEEAYGSDKIGGYGCGPTAMAIVVSTLTQEVIDPIQMAQHCVDQGYWARRHGSYHSIVSGVSEAFGLTCTPLPPEEADLNTVAQLLSTGQLMVALMGPGHFTNGGHFIVLRGITLEGSILVADPASKERSLTTWDLELLLEELSASRSSGAPLWVVSPSLS
ncbi:MAG: hypothetical protein HFF52_07760 [Lawsonibacter sp.]|nr:hypothetical protein [Lawsonibacter sp.]